MTELDFQRMQQERTSQELEISWKRVILITFICIGSVASLIYIALNI